MCAGKGDELRQSAAQSCASCVTHINCVTAWFVLMSHIVHVVSMEEVTMLDGSIVDQQKLVKGAVCSDLAFDSFDR